MALEDLTGTGKFVSALNPAWPVDDDWVDEGDNHIRGIKNVLKNTFPATTGAIHWGANSVLFPDGSAGAPGIAWLNDQDSGFHHLGGGTLRYVVNAGNVFSCDAAQFVLGTGVVLNANENVNVGKTLSVLQGASVTGQVVLQNAPWGGALADLTAATLVVRNTLGGNRVGITLHDATVAKAFVIKQEIGGPLYFGSSVGGGPCSGGYAVVFETNGVVYGGAYNNISDAGLKSDVRQVTGALAGILALRGVRYFNEITKKEDIGLVAQEVEPVFPEVVSDVPGGEGRKGVHYSAIVAPLIEAMRELEGRLAAIEAKLEALGASN